MNHPNPTPTPCNVRYAANISHLSAKRTPGGETLEEIARRWKDMQDGDFDSFYADDAEWENKMANLAEEYASQSVLTVEEAASAMNNVRFIDEAGE
jgi:hypothetical protein